MILSSGSPLTATLLKLTRTIPVVFVNIVDPVGERSIRIKVNDGEIVFPQSAVGNLAIVEGKLTKLELTRDQAISQARHEAEEQGRKFDPKSIKKGATIYMIQGAGAIIRD